MKKPRVLARLLAQELQGAQAADGAQASSSDPVIVTQGPRLDITDVNSGDVPAN